MKVIADLVKHYDKVFAAVKMTYSPSEFDEILDFVKFENILTKTRFMAGDVLLYKNSNLQPDSTLKFDRSRTAEPMLNTERFSNKKLLNIFKNEKIGIKINSIYDFSEPINEFRKQLARVLGCKVSVNSYYSPHSSEKILNAHRDPYNILILQIKGKKIFHFGKMTDNKVQTDSESIVLSAGEALYLPAQLAHHAEPAEGEDSLHLTIGFHPIAFREYFDFFTKHNTRWSTNIERKLPLSASGQILHDELALLVGNLTSSLTQGLNDENFLNEFLNYNSQKETI